MNNPISDWFKTKGKSGTNSDNFGGVLNCTIARLPQGTDVLTYLSFNGLIPECLILIDDYLSSL